ncbi:hypothetical protein GF322_01405 [Candidatus Dependentiae bacterium]|nr:hypothetical protein [Candidatus Dependentiae bacterium]
MKNFKIKLLIILLLLTNCNLAVASNIRNYFEATTAGLKYIPFALSDFYDFKGNEQRKIVYEMLYLSLDILDSLCKLCSCTKLRSFDNSSKEIDISKAEKVGFILLESFNIQFDLFSGIKKVDQFFKNKNIQNIKLKKNKKKKIKLDDLSENTMFKKQVFYTLFKHALVIIDIIISIDSSFINDLQVKNLQCLLRFFLKSLTRNIDNKTALIPNKALSCLIFLGIVVLIPIFLENKRKLEENLKQNPAKEEDEEKNYPSNNNSPKKSFKNLKEQYGDKVESYCPICYDEFEDNQSVILTDCCNHLFCKQCLIKYRFVQQNDYVDHNCPYCRCCMYILPESFLFSN